MDIDNLISKNELSSEKNSDIIIESDIPKESEKNYNDYKYSSFDEYLNEINQPKEDFPNDNNSRENQANAEINIPSAAEEKTNSANEKIKHTTAKVVTKTIDKALGFSAGLIALDPDCDDFYADDDDLKDLIEVWKEVLPSHKTIHPGFQLLMLYPVIYGPIFKRAFDARKQNKRIKELEQINFEKEKEIQKLKFEKAKHDIINNDASQNETKKTVVNDNKEVTPEIIETILKMHNDFVPMQKIADTIGVSYNKVRKICKKY